MIPGGGVGAGAQRAHVDEPFDTGLPRGGHNILRAERVNVFKRALSDFTDDAHEMNDGVDAATGALKRIRVENISEMNLCGQFPLRRLGSVGVTIARQNVCFVSRAWKPAHYLPSHKSRCACDEHLHVYATGADLMNRRAANPASPVPSAPGRPVA